ncbi:argonaute family protein [Actinidia rufa]|uniref:Argonaute family protein n=1 Tax=Actinidia rufa TaxID=165716 RepID=A0A7J0EG28_9ERIC|nr:argonaute family protein [Actinidia rufa]
MEKEASGSPQLPPPPEIIPLPVKPDKMGQLDPPKRSIMSRRGFGSTGRHISLLCRYALHEAYCAIYYWQVSISYEDKKAVENKGIGRKVIDKLYQTYSSELAEKRFAYDGEKSLYTVGPLPQNKLEFTVVLEESFAKHGSPPQNGEPYFAAKIPLKSISLALQGSEAQNTQDALRVLDIILRQQAANRGCLLVRQSFFHDDSRNFTDVGGGVTGCRGFHSSFRPTHGGLSLNMDVSTTMILTPGPVIDFLLANQNAREPRNIDWGKTRHSNKEFKIIGLSEKPCNQLFFPLKVKNSDIEHDGGQPLEITVYEYFTKHRNIELTFSAYMPCIDVGKPKRPSYLPLEAIRTYRYDDDPLLAASGISIEKKLTQVDGRVLEAPKLKFGNNEDFLPRNGRWNFNNKKQSSRIPLIKDTPTMILGMDVSHGSPGRSDIPSIAAVVGSRSWPLISRYRAAVRTQSSKVEMIESLYNPLANGDDDGIMRELLVDFYQTSNGRKPAQIIVFRDGVSESQFNQVLNWELDQMIKAFQHLGEVDVPKFTVVVAQKNHTQSSFKLVPLKMFLQHAAPAYVHFHSLSVQGTSRPAHYHVLLDEIGFSPDDLQNLIHSLSYVYQRSTSAVSIAAPVCYAHLAAQQMGQFIKFEDFSETSSGQKGLTMVGTAAVPQLPRLHKNVAHSMFFC